MKNIELYRKSSYVISVKLEHTDDKYMLIHGYTGAMDIVGKDLADQIKKMSKEEFVDSPFSAETTKMLYSRGYLTDKNIDEELNYVQHLAHLFHQRDKKLFKSFAFLVAYNCNFRCPYCFETNISQDGRHWSKRVFSKELVDKAYEAMLLIEPQKELHNKIITLYGGEPLLKENREIIDYILKRGKSLGYKFDAITNGYDLQAYMDVLTPGLIEALQITVDGCKERHDERRTHYVMGKSFDKIIENIGMALQRGIKVMVRVNTDANNFADLHYLGQLFEQLGYSSLPNFKMYSALLRGDNNDVTSQKLKYIGAKKFHDLHKKEKFRYNCQDYGTLNKIEATIRTKKIFELHSIYCGAQSGSAIFDPYSDFYSCYQTVGDKKHIIGHYGKGILEYSDASKHWYEHNISVSHKCSHCKYGLLCGGGCLAKADYNIESGFGKSFCNDYPSVFAIAVNKAYDALVTNKQFL